MAGSIVASFLTAPTIRLILPTSESGDDDLTYSVHRSLLSKYTSLLQSCRPRDSYVLLERSSTTVPTLEHTLEFLYTGDYILPAEPAEKEEEDDQPLLHSTRPAAHLPSSPLMFAAMAGAIGVWGKPAPVFEKADNTSTYTSEYFPQQNAGKDTAGQNDNSKLKVPNGLLPSPPLTPSATTFPSYSPLLSPKTSRSSSHSSLVPPKSAVTPQEPHHIFLFREHLSIYRFATLPSVHIPALSALTLAKLREQFTEIPLDKLPSLVIEFAREAFITRSDETELKEALVELAAGRARELSLRKEFNEFVKGGGEFIVLLLARLAKCEC